MYFRIFDTAKSAYCIRNDQYTDNSSFTGLRSNITRNSVLNQILETTKNAYCILNDYYTDNSSFLRADTDQEETKRK